MDNKEHYNQFLMYLDVAKSQEIDVRNILLRMANVLATQNYVIIEKLEELIKSK